MNQETAGAICEELKQNIHDVVSGNEIKTKFKNFCCTAELTDPGKGSLIPNMSKENAIAKYEAWDRKFPEIKTLDS